MIYTHKAKHFVAQVSALGGAGGDPGLSVGGERSKAHPPIRRYLSKDPHSGHRWAALVKSLICRKGTGTVLAGSIWRARGASRFSPRASWPMEECLLTMGLWLK